MRSDESILTISIAARLLGLHPRTLMLYEKEGLIEPHRTGTQRRMYSVNDLNHLQFLKFLIQEKGLNIKGTKLILEAIDKTKAEACDLKKLLFPNFKAVALF